MAISKEARDESFHCAFFFVCNVLFVLAITKGCYLVQASEKFICLV